MITNYSQNLLVEENTIQIPADQMVAKQSPAHIGNSSRNRLQLRIQRTVALIMVLTMLAAFAPQNAAAAGTDNFSTNGWYYQPPGGGSGTCTGCTIYNHNETLVEDLA